MTYPTPEPVVAAAPYLVLDVDGAQPTQLSDIDGQVVVTVEGGTGRHVVRGQAAHVGGRLRLHEKSEDGVGKDMRVWNITEEDGRLVARTD